MTMVQYTRKFRINNLYTVTVPDADAAHFFVAMRDCGVVISWEDKSICYDEFDVVVSDINEQDLDELGAPGYLNRCLFFPHPFPAPGRIYRDSCERLMIPLACQLAGYPEAPTVVVWFLVDTASPFTVITDRAAMTIFGNDRPPKQMELWIHCRSQAITCETSKGNFKQVNILGLNYLKAFELSVVIPWPQRTFYLVPGIPPPPFDVMNGLSPDPDEEYSRKSSYSSDSLPNGNIPSSLESSDETQDHNNCESYPNVGSEYNHEPHPSDPHEKVSESSASRNDNDHVVENSEALKNSENAPPVEDETSSDDSVNELNADEMLAKSKRLLRKAEQFLNAGVWISGGEMLYIAASTMVRSHFKRLGIWLSKHGAVCLGIHILEQCVGEAVREEVTVGWSAGMRGYHEEVTSVSSVREVRRLHAIIESLSPTVGLSLAREVAQRPRSLRPSEELRQLVNDQHNNECYRYVINDGSFSLIS